MDKALDFLIRSKNRRVYWKNIASSDDCVFKLTPEGNTYTKFKGEKEFKSNGSNIADESRLYALKEIKKEEYHGF